jgi:hypothetical protein
MATIKTQNGNVITKNGMVSCDCCDCYNAISGANVFEITKQEYYAYIKGGTWNVSGNVSIQESTSTGNSAVGTGSGSFSRSASGCSASIFSNFTSNIRYIVSNNTPFNARFRNTYGLEYSLNRNGDKYFVYFCGGTQINEGFWYCNNQTGTGQGTFNAIVDGNVLQLRSAWSPSWWQDGDPLPGYSNSSFSNMTATFTPSA